MKKGHEVKLFSKCPKKVLCVFFFIYFLFFIAKWAYQRTPAKLKKYKTYQANTNIYIFPWFSEVLCAPFCSSSIAISKEKQIDSSNKGICYGVMINTRKECWTTNGNRKTWDPRFYDWLVVSWDTVCDDGDGRVIDSQE